MWRLSLMWFAYSMFKILSRFMAVTVRYKCVRLFHHMYEAYSVQCTLRVDAHCLKYLSCFLTVPEIHLMENIHFASFTLHSSLWQNISYPHFFSLLLSSVLCVHFEFCSFLQSYPFKCPPLLFVWLYYCTDFKSKTIFTWCEALTTNIKKSSI